MSRSRHANGGGHSGKGNSEVAKVSLRCLDRDHVAVATPYPPARAPWPESSGKGGLPTALYWMTPRAENRTRLPRAAGRPLRFALSRGRRDFRSPISSQPRSHLLFEAHSARFWRIPGGGSCRARAPTSSLCSDSHHPPTESPSPFLNPCDFDETRCTTWNIQLLERFTPAGNTLL